MEQVTQKTAASAQQSAAAAHELTSQAANLGKTSRQIRDLLGLAG